LNKFIPIFIIGLIFLPIYSVSASIDYGSTSETNWKEICLMVEQVLVKPCSAFVNDNGRLTAQGEIAVDCIRNGALIGGGAYVLGVPLSFIKPGLEALAGMTDCDGIVNFDRFDDLDLPFILDLLG
jgi:hypothetical protein